MAPDNLDLRNLRCPLPVLRTRKVLRSLGPSALLVVECTDPLAEIDIPHLLQQTGDTLVSVEREGDVLRFTIRRGGAAHSQAEDRPAY